MRTSKIGFVMLLLLLGTIPSAMAQSAAVRTAMPYPNAATPKAIDMGPLAAKSGATPISVTVALRMRNLDQAESLMKSLSTPGNPQYHQFLTAQQFVARFGPADAVVAKVVAGLAKYGLTVERSSATTLKVTGPPADMERAFSVSLHSYEVPAHDNAAAYSYHAPLSHATIPAEISPSVAAVVGLDSRPTFHPHNHAALHTVAKAAAPSAASSTTPPDQPGYWTVFDFADYYDVNPLYRKGLSGEGRTIGIMTLASFTPSDAYAYWSALNIPVNSNRVAVVNVDGGPGAPSDASGSLETTLDVEQSGGIAPGANMIVYQAPNTNQGFVDLFATAIDANRAETLSISWGEWEWFENLENSPVTDPITGKTVSTTQAVHELLVRAAIQGESVFTSSADTGAYNANDGCPPPYQSGSAQPTCSLTLSVDYPASDTAITAAGGTTLAGVQELCLNAACTPPFFDVNVPHERVWGWDYLDGWCKAIGVPNPVSCGIFPVGSGGGVSITFDEPLYQIFLPGVQRSQPGQFFEGFGLEYALPPYYPGRNVPDVSFNADPETGYVIYYTSSAPGSQLAIYPFYGGTSFVDPQLNGVSTLIGQELHSRIGLWNYPLYYLALSGQAYRGSDAPLHAIRYGNNGFYHGSDGYNPGVGLGTLDVANFAKFLRDPF
ncbi:MAG: S53 family peptidase [Candidatus Acidiferrales bacterium]